VQRFIHYAKIDHMTINHLIFKCTIEIDVWNRCNKWLGISNVLYCYAKNHLSQFNIVGLNSKQNMAWKCMAWKCM